MESIKSGEMGEDLAMPCQVLPVRWGAIGDQSWGLTFFSFYVRNG